MFTVILLMLSGTFLGYIFRNQGIQKIHKLITPLIWLLLFLLGISVGNNEAIMKGMGTIGIDAFIITFGAMSVSVLGAWGLYLFLHKFKSSKRQK